MTTATAVRPQITMLPVVSSQISERGYDAPTKTLAIRFTKGGKVYRYLEFTQKHWDAFLKAPSAGKWFHANVRDKFKIEPDPQAD